MFFLVPFALDAKQTYPSIEHLITETAVEFLWVGFCDTQRVETSVDKL